MEKKELFKKLDKIKELPTLPVIAMEVNRMLQNQKASIELVSNTIEKDQAIVLKILKLVNSAFYGARSRVSSISEAVIRLGFNSVRNVVVSVSVIDSFSSRETFLHDFNLEDFWKHSIGVALTSKRLSEKTGLQQPEDAFVSGLLHDIGLIIMAQVFPKAFSTILDSVRDGNISIYNAEKSITPVNHSEIGEYLTKKWQLPSELCSAVRHHHAPSKNEINPELTTIVHMADTIINRFTVSSISPRKSKDEPDVSCLDDFAEKALMKHYRYADDWFPEHYENIREACKFFSKNENEQGVKNG